MPEAVVAATESPRRFELPPDPAPETPKPDTPEIASAAPAPSEPKKGESATPAPKVEPQTETPKPAEKPHTGRFERRLANAYRKAGEERARAEEAQRRATELQQQLEALRNPVDPNEPKLEQFDDIEKFAEAKAKYRSEKLLKEREEKEKSEAATRSQTEFQNRLSQNWETRTAEVDDKYPDFDEVVGDIKPTTWFTQAIMSAENAPDVAYHLGKHPEEAHRIAKLAPIDGIREIGKMEAKLALQPDKPKTPSKAPEPIQPVAGVEAPASDEPSENDDMESWIKKRRKQVYGRR